MQLNSESKEIVAHALAILKERIVDVNQEGMDVAQFAILRFRGIPASDWTIELKKRTTHIGSGKPASYSDQINNRAYAFMQESKLIAMQATEGDGDKVEIFVTITEAGVAYLEEHGLLSKRVFIVHGHDEAKALELKDFLRSLRLEPIILHQEDDRGLTIIEKFEHYAAQCSFAFVLLTPDDKVLQESPSSEYQWRTRQNVILELGWFMAKLGRGKIVVLHRGVVEIPSDILGVIYLSFQKNISEVGEKIRQRLRGARIISDNS